MRKLHTELAKTVLVATFVLGTVSAGLTAQPKKLSLLESNESYRIKLNAQPNIEKGEVVLAQKASVIFVIEQPLQGFLAQVASINKMKLTVSESVTGTLRKISLPMKLEGVMTELSKMHGLEWHTKNDHLYVSNNLENTNRLIKLGSLSLPNLKVALKSAGIRSGANKISFKQENNEILVIGSKEYIAKLEGVVKSFQTKGALNKTQKPAHQNTSNN